MLLGFQTALTPTNLFFCFVGVTLGTAVGALPGIGSLATMSILMSVTFYLEPVTAIIMLAGVYYGSDYGGSIASILLRLPGSPSSAIVCLDGYPMAQQGRAGVALFITAIGSFVGGSVAILAMALFAPGLATAALAFQSAEFFALMVLGLLAAGGIATGNPMKGVAMVVLGLLIGTVGTYIQEDVPRYTFDQLQLLDGVHIVLVAIGLFGVPEIIASFRNSPGEYTANDVTFRSMVPTKQDWRQSFMPMFRGSWLGTFLGILPGAGGTVASFASYAMEKRTARDPSRFGKGAIEGIVGPETANNAAAQASFIPTMALGIPGSATMAIILGALLIHGVNPGPGLMRNEPEIFWGLVASFWVGNIILLVLNIPLINIWVRLLNIPYGILYPAIIAFMCIGAYSVSNSVFDLWVLVVFSVLGCALRFLKFEPAPLLVGFVLGPLLEENMQRAFQLARGNMLVMLQRPVTLSLFIATLLLLAYMVFSWNARRRRLATARRDGDLAALDD